MAGKKERLTKGAQSKMAMWDPAFLEILEKKYTLILFHNRGVGFSTDTNKEELTIGKMAEDTAELIALLGYQRAHVLGWWATSSAKNV